MRFICNRAKRERESELIFFSGKIEYYFLQNCKYNGKKKKYTGECKIRSRRSRERKINEQEKAGHFVSPCQWVNGDDK